MDNLNFNFLVAEFLYCRSKRLDGALYVAFNDELKLLILTGLHALKEIIKVRALHRTLFGHLLGLGVGNRFTPRRTLILNYFKLVARLWCHR